MEILIRFLCSVAATLMFLVLYYFRYARERSGRPLPEWQIFIARISLGVLLITFAIIVMNN
ncbi:hypothetical protein [Priestia endophytica]|uniref:hypothetical protein n=1 Tax=Priestia endophytica TaxID=135735 RepID=UPI000F5462AC|nr:hypothetical protein [Priestia endophytica]MED4074362.1 hypothetical protein [Priestia endophytica]